MTVLMALLFLMIGETKPLAEKQKGETTFVDTWEDKIFFMEGPATYLLYNWLRRNLKKWLCSIMYAKFLSQAMRLNKVSSLFSLPSYPLHWLHLNVSWLELETLRSYFSPKYHLVLYQPTFEIRQEILDGGAAIIEQIVCSRAKYFIGSFESTFSFRIQEEREILGFPPNSTFNRFCADGNDSCEQPAKWKIVMWNE